MTCEYCQRPMHPWTRRGQAGPNATRAHRAFHRDCWQTYWERRAALGLLTQADAFEIPDKLLHVLAFGR